MPVVVRRVDVADELDFARIAHAQTALVRCTDESQVHWRYAHDPCRRGVDRNRVGACQDHILDVPSRCTGSRTFAGQRSIHHGENAGVNILLDLQQVDERFVDHAVRPMAFLVEQAAEGVLHRAGDVRKDVRLHRRQMQDILAVKEFGNADPVSIYLIEDEKRLFRFVGDPFNVLLVGLGCLQAVFFLNERMPIVELPFLSVHNDGVVVRGDQVVVRVAIGEHCLRHAFELPGGRRAAGVPNLPGDVDLEERFVLLGQIVRVARQMHQPSIILQDGLRRRP